MKSARTIRCMLGTILGMLLFSVSLFAQGSFGRILGTVTDQTGAVLPGATVSVVDTERGATRTLTADGAGEYNAPTLIPGNYTVRVEAKGFKRLERQNIVLEVGQELRVDLTPQPGDQTQTVTVTEAITLVDTASATLGGALSNAEVNDLPLNGRNYQSLLGLRPGVVLQKGGSPWTQSTNNSRPDETAWMIEGVLNSTFWDATPVVGGGSFLTDGASILPIDAIQEFNLQENPKAEFGWKPGAIVNVGIRSGTNAFHGSAYAFGRYEAWDARNIFDPGILNGAPFAKLPTQLEQFGAVVGGRIKKDKLFFFGGYEGLQSLVGTVYAIRIPETGPQPIPDPANSMVDAMAALNARGIPISPVSMKLLGCASAAACTGGLIAAATPNSTSWTSTFPNTNNSKNGIAKIDYNVNDKNRINGMIYVSRYRGSGQDFPQVNELFTDSFPKTTWTGDGNWVWIPNSSLVNEARFGYNAGTTNALGNDPGLADGSGGLCTATGCGGKGYPINTGLTGAPPGLPTIYVSGFAGGQGQGFLGGRGGRPVVFGPSSFYDFNDSVSLLRGRHALKFGFEFARIISGTDQQDTRGRIQFKGDQAFAGSAPLEDFFAGLPKTGIQLSGNGLLAVRWNHPAAFFQDDWRITPKLMLNLGMRWEYNAPIQADNNLLGNFYPMVGLVQQGQAGVGSTLIKPDYKNISPRAGFAWDITGKGTTVLRGGAGIMYATMPLATLVSQPGEQNVGGGVGLANIPTGACAMAVPIGTPCPATIDPGAPGKGITLGTASIPGSALNWNGVVFPSGAGISCTPQVPCSVAGIDPNLKTPYSINWNLGVQHAFGSNLSLDVAYVATHGDNLLGIRDINSCPPNTAGCSAALRPYNNAFPYLKYINYTSNYGRSNFDSLQTTLTKRLSHGLNFTVGYTYGHGLDNGSLNRFGLLPQNSLNPGAEYASSDFDVRHRVSITTSYAIPGKKGFGQLLEGWKLNTIVNLQGAQPWNTNDTSFNFSGNGDSSDRWDFFGNPSDFKAIGTHSIPYCSGPGLNGCSITDAISGQIFFSPAQSTAMWGQCTAVAPDPGTLNTAGCFVSGKSVMTPPTNGTFGTMGRNIFRDTGFKNVDFSIFKDFKFKERFGAEFRFEVFNLFNHPIFANPYGSAPGNSGQLDPSSTGVFGCGCSTPDAQAGNPIVGSGGSRDIQLGLKLTF